MELAAVPPLHLSPVTDTIQSWRYVENQSPVDFTQTLDGQSWAAEFLIQNCGLVVHRAAATLDAEGYVSVSVPAATSAALRSGRRIDANYQIRFTSPASPDFDMAWQGPVIVQEIIE